MCCAACAWLKQKLQQCKSTYDGVFLESNKTSMLLAYIKAAKKRIVFFTKTSDYTTRRIIIRYAITLFY